MTRSDSDVGWRPPVQPLTALEVFFPAGPVTTVADRESKAKARYRPLYFIHKWWARRLGVATRTVLKLLVVPASEAPALRARLSDLAGFLDWYVTDDDAGGKLLLDPFMGGGTTLVEARRLNFRVVGCDLNPVAWFLVKKELERFDASKFEEAFRDVESRVAERVLRYYRTTCPTCSGRADVMYWFWVKQATCKSCGSTVHLFKDHVFVEPRNRVGTLKTFVCPSCLALFDLDVATSGGEVVPCPRCGFQVPPEGGGPVRGRSFRCPSCGETETLVAHAARAGPFPQVLYACEYYCPSCGDKGYKETTGEDWELFQEAGAELREVGRELPLPDQAIPDGYNTSQLFGHGIRHFSQLFNDRQLLCLGLMYREILDVTDPSAREYLVLTFSTCLEFNNVLCSYARAKRHLYNAFKSHTLHPPLTPCEGNPWGTKFGRGIFRSQVKRALEGKAWGAAPWELVPPVPAGGKSRGSAPKRIRTKRPVDCHVVTSWDHRRERGAADVPEALLLCQDASHLPLPPKSVQFVVTDPPYFDNVHYSELSDVYYVWLRQGLVDAYPAFRPPLTPKEEEVVKNLARGLTGEHYRRKLTEVFKEIARVLVDEGVLAFTFHHRGHAAWEALLLSLLDAGLAAVACHPVRVESKISPSIIYKESVEFDLVVVCRKVPREYEPPAWSPEKLVEEALALLTSGSRDGGNESQVNKFVLGVSKVLVFLSWHLGERNRAAAGLVLEEVQKKSGV
ncbi:MAG: DUF1156 domain-containing protein [Promethearchaeota archaeon]